MVARWGVQSEAEYVAAERQLRVIQGRGNGFSGEDIVELERKADEPSMRILR
ncbi:hypothetical protein [Actinomadura sp. SCN-SB]|uniref:hypothetical protein n=1 Tax=Actinomadura sp. SCN-SB TaxID=3373092 RepID=UPI0037510F8E